MLTALQLAGRVMGGTVCSCPARANGRKCVRCPPDWQCSSILAIFHRSLIISCPFSTRPTLAQLAAQARMVLTLDVCVCACVWELVSGVSSNSRVSPWAVDITSLLTRARNRFSAPFTLGPHQPPERTQGHSLWGWGGGGQTSCRSCSAITNFANDLNHKRHQENKTSAINWSHTN